MLSRCRVWWFAGSKDRREWVAAPHAPRGFCLDCVLWASTLCLERRNACSNSYDIVNLGEQTLAYDPRTTGIRRLYCNIARPPPSVAEESLLAEECLLAEEGLQAAPLKPLRYPSGAKRWHGDLLQDERLRITGARSSDLAAPDLDQRGESAGDLRRSPS